MQFVAYILKALNRLFTSEPILPTHYTETNKPLKGLIINA